MIDQIVNNPWLGVVGLAVGVVSFVASIVFYLRAQRPKLPVFSTASFVIVGKHLQARGLQVTLDGKELTETLVLSTLTFWNRGTGLLTRDDVAAADPLRIESVDGVVIYSAWVTKSKPANQCVCEMSDGKVLLRFDYLGQGEGFEVAMFRTSKEVRTTSATDLYLAGTIKGHRVAAYQSDQQKYLDAVMSPVTRPLDSAKRTKSLLLTTLVVLVIIAPMLALFVVVGVPAMLLDNVRNWRNQSVDKPFTT